MNQILVTKKLYVTPELKRKKKIYKFDFLLSIFLMIVLISVYIYAEYDRNKSAEASQEILEEIRNTDIEEDNTTVKDDSVLVVVLDDSSQTEEVNEQQPQEEAEEVNTKINNQPVKKTVDGYTYQTTATIMIPKIGVDLPILEGETGSVKETERLLKISPCKFWGPNINEVGNYCIVGHNYRNELFFSKVPTLVNGDKITISETSGRVVTYEVYDKYVVEPSNKSCTSQLTGGKKEITLITCTDDSQGRYIIKAREVK